MPIILDFDRGRIVGVNQGVVNSDPVDVNVNQFMPHVANNHTYKVDMEQRSDLNTAFPTVVIPNSQPNNLFPTLIEPLIFPTVIPNAQPNIPFPTLIEPPTEDTHQNGYGVQNLYQQPMWDVNHHQMASHGLPSGFWNSASDYNSASVNMFNPQYFGGSSSNNVASTNISSSRISVSEAFDGRMVPPSSLLDPVSSSSNQNFHRLPLLHEGQYRSSAGEKQIAYAMNPQQPNQWALQFQQNDQSNGFKIRRLNSWAPVQARPHAAEGSSSQSCYGVNDNHHGSAGFVIESRKRKYQFEPLSSESLKGSGTLWEVVAKACKPDKMPDLEQYPDDSDAIANGFKESPWSSFEQKNSDRREKSSEVEPKESIGTLMDIIARCCMNKSVGDQVSQDSSAFFSQQHLPFVQPSLEQWNNNSEHLSVINPLTMNSDPKVNNILTVDAMPNNQISKGPEGNSYAANVASKEPVDFCFEEKTSNKKEELIQVGSNGFNTALDDHESALESMRFAAMNELLSEKPKTEISFVDGNGSGSEFGNIRLNSASLAESFTASQIKEYLTSFMEHNKEILASTVSSIDQNRCQLCSKDKLVLASAPLYCSSCDLRIKQNVSYYQSTNEENTDKHGICKSCFRGSRGFIVFLRGGCISKANLELAKNDEENDDSWVQCDRCSNWQHRICGLYNNETDEEGKAEYVCPKCCLKEIENGTRIPLPKTVLGAKDLPRTNLSDHIEQRLFRCMKQEREETARSHGIELEKVPEAEGLVVRVVMSVDKELEVKQQFRDIIDGQAYPEKFAYRSKLILLFQRRGGVDLCLFGMYVQEFGSECEGPNKRCVYISYIDSVKYFQPERRTSNGESLRTVVYHEILIGYLEYCKKRGFETCYIWACPLREGDDYIFYSRPETQKTPKQDKLRQWYKLMIRKAEDDGIVVDNTNLYEQFFKKGNIKISAANLPYFDGDHWSEAAQRISMEIQEDEEKEKLGESRCKSPTRRILMANPTRDDLVMQRLGVSIRPIRENFMIIRLQHKCTSCHETILSGSRWFCNQCIKIQWCSRCFDAGKSLSRSRMHSCHSGKSTQLFEEVVKDVPLDTKDEDDVLVNKFMETREGFLHKCQRSQYQFNTLAFAKYSSMMMLYHFTHNLVVQPKADTRHTHN